LVSFDADLKKINQLSPMNFSRRGGCEWIGSAGPVDSVWVFGVVHRIGVVLFRQAGFAFWRLWWFQDGDKSRSWKTTGRIMVSKLITD